MPLPSTGPHIFQLISFKNFKLKKYIRNRQTASTRGVAGGGFGAIRGATLFALITCAVGGGERNKPDKLSKRSTKINCTVVGGLGIIEAASAGATPVFDDLFPMYVYITDE